MIQQSQNQRQVDHIEELLINYNEKFKTADPILFRDESVYQVISILIGKTKPNAVLVGPAGVGKTKLVEDLARRIENKDASIPYNLKDKIIYELPLSNLVAGSSLVGQLEEKVQDFIEFASDPKNKAIIFIDEIHQLLDSSSSYKEIAQFLKPALARGDIKCIGATTVQEAKILSSDPAFERRFSKLIIDELTQSQTVEILKLIKSSYTKHYKNILIDDNILEKLVQIADNYSNTYSHRPDNAITLLDRTCGAIIIGHNKKLQCAINTGNKVAEKALKSIQFLHLTEEKMKQTAISLATGNAKKDIFDLASLEKRLKYIKGQDESLKLITKKLYIDSLGTFPRNKPLTFLFAGPSGCGKSATVKEIAQELTGVKPISLSMTEYNSPASINRIIGSPIGYVGSNSKAELPFDILETNPYQVILLDEFEKADEAVQMLFMGAFDDGYIKTARGRLVDFSKSIIIATTNATHSKGSSEDIGFIQEKTKSKQDFMDDLSQYFRKELLGRFKIILNFNSLSKETYAEILRETYENEAQRIMDNNRKINLNKSLTDDELNELVEQTYVEAFGARPATDAIQTFIEKKLI